MPAMGGTGVFYYNCPAAHFMIIALNSSRNEGHNERIDGAG